MEGYGQRNHMVRFIVSQLLHELEAARLETERPVRKSIAIIHERLMGLWTKLGPVEVLIERHSWEVENEGGQDSV